MTINGLRTVKDHVKLCGEPHNVHIAKELLQATRKAHKVYGKRLLKEKEELLRKKAIQDGKTEDNRKPRSFEQSRLNLFETEIELLKSEIKKSIRTVSCKLTAKTLYEETNERLKQAIQNKNFNEAVVAQGFLEVAKKKMENAMDQAKQGSNERTELDKSKKRLLEGYTKHVLTKKTKDSH